MSGTNTVGELDFALDLFGQQATLNIYTQLCLCYPVADVTSYPKIIEQLTNGLGRLAAGFPWVAGQVVDERSDETKLGVFKIRKLDTIPRLVVKDLRDDTSVPTWNELKQANFPFRMLDESVVSPRSTLPGVHDTLPPDQIPVFLLQASFIAGGLILTFLSQHQVMDMTGQAQLMYLLSKACRQEEFTSEELLIGNLARQDLIPLLEDSYKPGQDIAHQIVNPQPVVSESDPELIASPEATKSCWAYFAFSGTSLAAIKSLATKTITLPSGFVSTDDALTAFIWQAVTRARSPRLKPGIKTTVARAVDTRKFLGIDPNYPGLVQNMTYLSHTIEELVEEPLGVIASELRSAVDPTTSKLAYSTQALATSMHRATDKSIYSFTATLDPSKDIMLSSWARFGVYALDFGLGLGRPASIRRPHFTPFKSLIYFMPKRPDGEIVVGISLSDDDMERLKQDPLLIEYGEYIP